MIFDASIQPKNRNSTQLILPNPERCRDVLLASMPLDRP